MIKLHDEKEDEEKKDDKAPESSFDKDQNDYFLNNRRIFLWKGVDDETAQKIVQRLLYLDSLNNEDITLFINSPGGVISSGLAIYDAMQTIKSDVRTVVTGQAASMGAVLLCAGAPGKRIAWKHSRIMIHQPLIQGQFYGPATDIEIQAEEMLRVRHSLNAILAEHSGKSENQIEIDTDRDNFMSADEATTYGLIDKVENFL
jgi:ATP-dependent Clp protease, protease subunit|tara:strand:+ start:590 stop:1195 length:606 start_codon:yes stop_codon:yes gene_type:complete